VRALKQGQEVERNFELLYRQCSARVFAFFRRKKKSVEEAQELTQETFFSVFMSLNQLRRDDQFIIWLYQIARRTLYNQRQKEHARKRTGQNVPFDHFGTDEFDEGSSPAARLSDPTHTPLESLLEKEHMQQIREAIQRLPDRARHCLELRINGGLQYHQIAQVMGISINTVKSHLNQARELLREQLGERLDEIEL
jgi:RNA polymerase sigma-70 factor (ECF subfamily)